MSKHGREAVTWPDPKSTPRETVRLRWAPSQMRSARVAEFIDLTDALSTPQHEDHEALPEVIQERLTEAEELTDLEEDWDGFGSSPVSESTLREARIFLETYFAGISSDLPAPDITPSQDGGLELFWETDEKRINVIIEPPDSGKTSVFYGKKRSGEIYKGPINPEEFNRQLADWILEG